jgi:hypothetical protein
LPVQGVTHWFKNIKQPKITVLFSLEHVNFGKKCPKRYLVPETMRHRTECLLYFLTSDPSPDYGSEDTDPEKDPHQNILDLK